MTEAHVEVYFERRAKPLTSVAKVACASEEYLAAMTGYRLAEIDADSILFDYEAALNENRWFAREYPFLSQDYWYFGASGQGDSWLIGPDALVYWYDHDLGEMEVENLRPLGLTFLQFLSMSWVVKSAEADTERDPNFFDGAEHRAAFEARLNAIRPGLSSLYPYRFFEGAS